MKIVQIVVDEWNNKIVGLGDDSRIYFWDKNTTEFKLLDK